MSFTCSSCSINRGYCRCKQVWMRNPQQQPLANMKRNKGCTRVVVPNVVYLMNLPVDVSSEDLLRSASFLGQYGRIERVIVHKNGTAHVTFATEIAAKACLQVLDGFLLHGARISALVGTTKYPEDIDMQRIAMNNRNEVRPPLCSQPIFPRPLWDDDSASTVSSMSMTDEELDECSSREGSVSYPESTPSPLIFGTGGLIDSIWADSVFGYVAIPFIPKMISEDIPRKRESCVSSSPDKSSIPLLPLQMLTHEIPMHAVDMSPRGVTDFEDIISLNNCHEELKQAIHAAEWLPCPIPPYAIPSHMINYELAWMAHFAGPITVLPGMFSF